MVEIFKRRKFEIRKCITSLFFFFLSPSLSLSQPKARSVRASIIFLSQLGRVYWLCSRCQTSKKEGIQAGKGRSFSSFFFHLRDGPSEEIGGAAAAAFNLDLDPCSRRHRGGAVFDRGRRGRGRSSSTLPSNAPPFLPRTKTAAAAATTTAAKAR